MCLSSLALYFHFMNPLHYHYWLTDGQTLLVFNSVLVSRANIPYMAMVADVIV